MLSINTNLSSLIAQNSMKTSSFKLDTAIERMTTGYKINHAKDNAANYSISTNMTTKIGAYMVAEDNALQGLDMINTASENLSLIEDKLIRLRALATQASNGTYGTQSLSAINAEANALVDEVDKLYASASYNNVGLFKAESMENPIDRIQALIASANLPTPGDVKVSSDGFIQAVTRKDTTTMTQMADVDPATTIYSGTYAISTVADLLKYKDMSIRGGTFVLANDIDLSAYNTGEGWEPIVLKGTFDGNGFAIKNLYINRPDEDYQGFFSQVLGANSTSSSGVGNIINLSVKNANVIGNNYVGAIIGYAYSRMEAPKIVNCNSSGTVTAKGNYAGGIAGSSETIEYCYSMCDIIGDIQNSRYVGGLVGEIDSGDITNSFATGSAQGYYYVGGLVGDHYSWNGYGVINCYATGDVYGHESVGGLAGYSNGIKDSYATGNVEASMGMSMLLGGLLGGESSSGIRNISNCYATGDVKGAFRYGGGLAGSATSIEYSYSTGDVEGSAVLGGLCGEIRNSITKSYSTGDVYGPSGTEGGNQFVYGAFLGGMDSIYTTNAIITDCYSTGDLILPLNGNTRSGGFVGEARKNVTISGCYLGGIADNISGVFVGNTNSVTSLSVTNCSYNPYYEGKFADVGGTFTGATVENIKVFDSNNKVNIAFQIGISATNNSQLGISLSFSLDTVDTLRTIGTDSLDHIAEIDNLLNAVSLKQTEYGAVQNRLESVLEEISTQYENLVSSRSTIRDADMAEVSSEYIRQQILQQASATLMSTANQSPSIALQLI